MDLISELELAAGGLEGFARLKQQDAVDAEFAALVARRSRFLFQVAFAVLRNVQDAEDAVQETFLKLYRNRAWHGLRDEKAFLARAGWRVAIDRLPKREMVDVQEEMPARGDSPEQMAITANWESVVHGLVDALPEELRQPLALSAIEELNSREISVVMGIPEGTVRTRIMRAREILKQQL